MSILTASSSDLELKSLVEKCKKSSHILEVMENASSKRYHSDKINAFTAGVLDKGADLTGKPEMIPFQEAAVALWEYIGKHGLTTAMSNRIKMEIFLNI